ncbi:MAG TPA: ABC transporter permease [Thermoanaerobaculia bacterium]|nr:ABC transporter permease [Thermoanaerobaculia bacterium]
MGSFLQDVRYAFRSLLKSPGFTAVAVVILTLGIGANATIFTLVSELFFEPPAGVGEPGGVVRLHRFNKQDPEEWWSHPDYVYFRERNRSFSGLAAYSPDLVPVTVATPLGGDRPLRAEAAYVSGNFFDVLKVRPAAGRGFLPQEGAAPGQAAVVVVGHGFWRRSLGGNPEVVGSPLRLNGHPFTVVGVAPAEFQGVSPVEPAADLWVPVTMHPVLTPSESDWLNRVKDSEVSWLQVLGRLRPGTSPEAAKTDMDLLSAAFTQEFPETAREGQRVELMPSFQLLATAKSQLEKLAGLLLAVVALVLLVASANVAILLLARATARRKDFGVRVALGANRRRIVSQLLAESVLLSLAGGIGGYLLAFWTASLASRALPFQFAVGFAPDARVLALTLAVATASAVLFGLAPALQASRADVVSLIKLGDPGSGRSRPLEILVVAQVALSIVLVAGAALFVRSLRAAESVDLGFQTENRLLVSMNLANHGYDKEGLIRFVDQAVERTAALPGVRRVSTVQLAPFGGRWRTGFHEGPLVGSQVNVNAVGPGYFEAMGIPLVAGRGFTAQDREESPRVLIINETLARRLWPNGDPVGQTFGLWGEPKTVVGVVKNAVYHELGEAPVQHVYLPTLQVGAKDFSLLLETAGNPKALARSVEDAIHSIDPDVAIAKIATMEEAIEKVFGRYRVSATLVTLFAAIALTLAAVGLYGTLSYLVAQSRRAIGVRLALGATAKRIVRSVVTRGLVLSGIGIVLGIAAAWGASRLVEGFVYGVSPQDPATFVLVAVILVAVTCLASCLPALRASRVDPVDVLK